MRPRLVARDDVAPISPEGVRGGGAYPVTPNAVVCIDFGQEGNDAYHLGPGWSGDEPGYRWAIDDRSELWLENPGSRTDLILELDVDPFVVESALPIQKLRVEIRGSLVGEVSLSRSGKVGFHVPGSIFSAPGPVRVVFYHPNAARPADLNQGNDTRELTVSFRRLELLPVGPTESIRAEPIPGVTAADVGRLVGIPAVQFMHGFESLGDNCEFGLVQRRCGAEPLGLLRFANLELRQLLISLQSRFDGIGEPSEMEFWLSDGAQREYVIRDRRHALVFHTFVYEGALKHEELIEKQAKRLRFLRRKLLEDLENAEKIFVCKRNTPLTEQEVLPLHAALQRFGRSTLLWMVPADAKHPPGAVDTIMPGLLRGYVDRFAPHEDAHDLSLEAWLSVCINASRLTREMALQPQGALDQ